MATYKYDRISDEPGKIRILKLRPGRSSDIIMCDLETTSLHSDELPEYHAVSYCWGERQPKETIQLGGYPAEVTYNLHSALTHLRDKRKGVRLWIDALCINQKDTDEQMHQVSQMRTIFHAAGKVIVWLGGGDDESMYAMDWLKSVPKDAIFEHKTVWQLLQRPWWTRIWVLQEVAAARNEPIIRCGKEEMRWSTLDRLESKVPFSDWMQSSVWLSNLPATNNEASKLMRSLSHIQMFLMIVKHLRKGNLLSWREVFALRLTMKATLEKDMVYALLGVIKEDNTSPLPPDYTKADDTVFYMAVARSIESKNGLQSLTYTSPSLHDDLPSWVPRLPGGKVGVFLKPGTHMYRASGSTVPKARWSTNYTVMWIEGVVIDCVAKVAAAQSATLRESKKLGYAVGHELGLTEAETRDRFWRTMIGNQGLDRFTNSIEYPAPEHFGLRFLAYEREIEVPSSAIGEGIRIEWELEYPKPWSSALSAFHENRQSQFFTTESGRFGIGQTGVRKGDVACILTGGNAVFLLRQCQEYFTLVGGAYVHGVMDGELSGLLQDPAKVTEFEIH